MYDDELDDDLERRFRDLEQREEVDRLRERAAREEPESAPPRTQSGPERFVLLTCPDCGAKNRTSLRKLLSHLPRCGRCRAEVSFV